jgi:hypothetical protein
MSFKNLTTSAAVIASMLAASIVPFATAANAHDSRYGNDRGYSRNYDSQRYYGGDRYDYGPRHRYAKRHRHNHGKDLAKGLAIGLGVLAVGSIIAHSR